MVTYIIVSTLCSAGLFFYNIKKRFTEKISYVLLFLITYAILINVMHDGDGSNIFFGIYLAFPALFVSMMFTSLLSFPLSAFSDGINMIFELILEYKLYASIIIALLIGIYFFSN